MWNSTVFHIVLNFVQYFFISDYQCITCVEWVAYFVAWILLWDNKLKIESSCNT